MAGLEHAVRKPESNHCFEVFHRAFMMNLKLKNILSDQSCKLNAILAKTCCIFPLRVKT